MISKAIVLPAAKIARRTSGSGLLLLLILFGLLFAVALVSAFTHPEAGDMYEIQARL